MQNVTIHTETSDHQNERNVTLWLNPDGTVSLLGNLPHGTHIIVNQKLVDDLQALVNTIQNK
jgi:hypothetical protein